MTIEQCLARIDARDEQVHAWCHLDRAAHGGPGPLAGLVGGIKDVVDVAGMPTTHGSPIYAGAIAARDAEAVARLRAAGAVILGKTVTAEFATYQPGPTVNPRKPGHTPGGSSSGSAAAVADGQADFALGTQTAGSMIRPGAFCGTLAFKPSFGRYPLAGVLETSPSLDTLGVFASRLPVLAAVDAVIAGDDALPDPRRPLTVGLCRMPEWREASAEMQQALIDYGARLAAAGLAVVDVELPEPFQRLGAAQTLIHRHEAALAMGYIRRDHPDRVSDAFKAMIDAGAADSDADYRAARALQEECRDLIDAAFAGVDVLVAPGAPGAAPEGIDATGNPVFQRIWTAVGTPCLGFPAAWRADGLPLGLQAIARPSEDRQLLADAPSLLAHAELREP
ncbi:MAG: amidase [Sphingomonadales bacterium]|nr:amidase [Sphingomonadales bacterium]